LEDFRGCVSFGEILGRILKLWHDEGVEKRREMEK
jgi:hypothetical protein